MLPLRLGDPHGPLTILCIGAHSDDIEIGAGGALLRLLAERGACKLHWVVFSAIGERGEEARRSAAAFGADATELHVTTHAFRESHFPIEWEAIKADFESLKDVRPDIVFTHRAADEHQDHSVLGRLVWNTFRDHVVVEFEIPKYEGDLGRPNLFVPIPTEVAERKVALLLEHFASQRSRRWFRPETFRGLMALRGVECNAPDGWAEAFHCRKLVL